MSARIAAWILGGVIAVVQTALFAQDAQSPHNIGNSTPPELRDFRLDAPSPRPLPEPSQTQPAAVEQDANVPQPKMDPPAAERATAARQPARAVTPKPEVSAPPPSEANAAQPGFSADGIIAPTPGVVSAPEPVQPPARASVPSISSNEVSWYVFLIAAVSLAMIGLAFAYFRRRKRTAEPGQAHDIHQPSPPVRLAQPKQTTLVSDVLAPVMNGEFSPEFAQLSIASLTITGRLKISNKGTLPIDGLILRSHMISAQEGQAETIEAFYAAKPAGSIEPLGGLQIGETMDVVIEIRLPRAELPTFRWSEREFIAPIILIHVSGQSEGQKCELRLSHLIGRAGADERSRMKPLATDRGPKRFAGVCARPVFA